MKTFYIMVLCFLTAHSVLAQRTDKRMILGFEETGRLAVAASAEIKMFRAQRALREGTWALSMRAFLPQLSFVASEDERLSLISADSFTKTYSINMEQLLFDGGRTRTARAAERTELILLSDELKRNESAVIEAALSFYRQILLSRLIIVIREAALLSLNEQKRILEEELILGMIIPLDLIHADITVREAELELLSMKIQGEELEKQFMELLGLDDMPELSEQVDIYRSPVIPDAIAVHRLALGRNPDLHRIVHSIMQKETEAKFASRSWIPAVKAIGTYSVSGQHYPLTRQSWTAGITLSFSSPWFGASTGGSAGWEPPYDKTAKLQGSFTPLPDPASGLSAKQAGLALALERENYQNVLDRLARQAVLEVNNLQLNEQRRMLAVESLKLGAEKYRLSEVLLSLGRITRLELMEERLEYEKKEMVAVEAAIALLEAERSLERFIDLPPGSLESFFRRYRSIQ
ncbi:MAG: TolC family protein [Treponema sp.]|nr:TolC family protein [Treponema sp.]